MVELRMPVHTGRGRSARNDAPNIRSYAVTPRSLFHVCFLHTMLNAPLLTTLICTVSSPASIHTRYGKTPCGNPASRPQPQIPFSNAYTAGPYELGPEQHGNTTAVVGFEVKREVCWRRLGEVYYSGP